MNFLKIGSVLVIGFIVGAALFHGPTVKANPQASGSVMLFIHPVLMLDAKTPIPKTVSGGRVAGISCIPKPEKRLPDAAVCYIATDNN